MQADAKATVFTSLKRQKNLAERFPLLKYICKMIANLCKEAISGSCITHERERPILKRFQIIRWYQEFSRWNLNTPTCTALITAAEWADGKEKGWHSQAPPQVICTHNLKARWPQDKSQLTARVTENEVSQLVCISTGKLTAANET